MVFSSLGLTNTTFLAPCEVTHLSFQRLPLKMIESRAIAVSQEPFILSGILQKAGAKEGRNLIRNHYKGVNRNADASEQCH